SPASSSIGRTRTNSSLSSLMPVIVRPGCSMHAAHSATCSGTKPCGCRRSPDGRTTGERTPTIPVRSWNRPRSGSKWPRWLLHTLALACLDADFAARQLQSLLNGTLKHRNAGAPIHHEWQALKPWAALLMYRLQRPRRPRHARADLADNFETLSSQTAGGG